MSKTTSQFISDEVTTHGLRLAEPAIKDMCDRRGIDASFAMRFAEHVDRLASVDALATDADHATLSKMARELDALGGHEMHPLHPFKFIHARTPADITDPENTIGIEVTDPAVAARCRENLDGQHGPGLATFDRWPGKAAVEIATHVYESPTGTTFATSRPDLDSVAAMAIFVIRAIGLWPFGEEIAERDRVRMIADADNFVAPPEWEPSPLPTEANPWPRVGSVDSRPELAHLAAICSPRRGEEEYPIAQRVVIVAAWILYGDRCAECNSVDNIARGCAACGDVNPIEFHRLALANIARACGLEPHAYKDAAELVLRRMRNAMFDVTKTRRELARWISLPGSLKIACRECLAEYGPLRLESGNCAVCGHVTAHNIAIVRVAHAGAIGLGYCIAPVVVAMDAANPGKVTIACYNTRYLNVNELLADLRKREPGWGGNTRSGIIGSPQNGGTKLTDDEIVNLVAKRMN